MTFLRVKHALYLSYEYKSCMLNFIYLQVHILPTCFINTLQKYFYNQTFSALPRWCLIETFYTASPSGKNKIFFNLQVKVKKNVKHHNQFSRKCSEIFAEVNEWKKKFSKLKIRFSYKHRLLKQN